MQDLRWPTYAPRNVTLESAVAERAEPGRGSFYVRDAEGNVYLDAIMGIGCGPLGHAHPKWVAALHEQAAKLTLAAGTFWTKPNADFVAEINSRVPLKDARSFIGNTGTEVTEAAIKLTLRAKPERDVIVACDRAFHGRSLGSIALTGTAKYRQPFVACLGEDHDWFARMNVARVPFNDLDAARETFERYEGRVGAMFLEPIQGEAGIYPATREYLHGLRELCNRHGVLLGADEIQAGGGRTGHFTAWETIAGPDHETAPDIFWHAKAIGGGIPVSTCTTTIALAESMGRGSHGSTFGGNPLATAAGLATLRIIDEEELMASAASQLPAMREIVDANPHPRVAEVRGLGAMIGIEIKGDKTPAASVGTAAMDQGLLVTVCQGKTVRMLLPYGAGRTHLEEAWTKLRAALDAAD